MKFVKYKSSNMDFNTLTVLIDNFVIKILFILKMPNYLFSWDLEMTDTSGYYKKYIVTHLIEF